MNEANPTLAGAGFDRIAIVGLGLIGASIALGTRRAQSAATISGVDRADVLRKALERGIVDAASERLDIVAGADLVILAAPVEQNVELVRQVSRFVSAAAVVTDVGSTKRATVEAARSLAASLTFVGGHPLAGTASGGIDSATADLFVGRRWVLTPGEAAAPETLARLCSFVRTLGAEPHLMDPAEHDRVLAFTSHMPQLAASALMRVVGEGAGMAGLALAGPGLADSTRLAGSPFGIWRDICLTNADNICAALDALIGTLGYIRAHAAAALPLEEIFSEARMWRERACSAARHGVTESDSSRESA
jgi:prephenate dehydrogenase